MIQGKQKELTKIYMYMAQSMYVYKQSHIKISINACVFGILTYYYIKIQQQEG